MGRSHLRAGLRGNIAERWDHTASRAKGKKAALGALGYKSMGRRVGWEQEKSCDLLKPIVPTAANGPLCCIIVYVTTV